MTIPRKLRRAALQAGYYISDVSATARNTSNSSNRTFNLDVGDPSEAPHILIEWHYDSAGTGSPRTLNTCRVDGNNANIVAQRQHNQANFPGVALAIIDGSALSGVLGVQGIFSGNTNAARCTVRRTNLPLVATVTGGRNGDARDVTHQLSNSIPPGEVGATAVLMGQHRQNNYSNYDHQGIYDPDQIQELTNNLTGGDNTSSCVAYHGILDENIQWRTSSADRYASCFAIWN